MIINDDWREGLSLNSVVAVGCDEFEVTTGTISKKPVKPHCFFSRVQMFKMKEIIIKNI